MDLNKKIDKRLRYLLVFCIGLSLLLGAGTFIKIAKSATGVPSGNPLLGTSTLALSTSTSASATPLNFALSGSHSWATNGGTATGVPCYNLNLSLQVASGGTQTCLGVLVGATSSSCYYPLTANYSTAGTLASYSLPSYVFPATNLNQLWVKLNISGGTYGGSLSNTATLNAAYTEVSP
jgi:hypothetical protein